MTDEKRQALFEKEKNHTDKTVKLVPILQEKAISISVRNSAIIRRAGLIK